MRITAEGVGQDDVRAGVHESLVKPRYLFGPIDRPEFGRLPRGEACAEVVGSRGAISEQHVLAREQIRECRTHRSDDSVSALVDAAPRPHGFFGHAEWRVLLAFYLSGAAYPYLTLQEGLITRCFFASDV